MKVVVRYLTQFSQYHIAHAVSYQNAFGSKINRFDTRSDAIAFAEKNGCTVLHHPDDPLQNMEFDK